MKHCNSVFSASDIWYLVDLDNEIKRKMYLANCPICNKEMVLYTSILNDEYFEKYYYSFGAIKIKKRLKKDVTSTMLGFREKYKSPSGFKYGQNKEIIKNGKIIRIEQYACDFWGNKILVKKIDNG